MRQNLAENEHYINRQIILLQHKFVSVKEFSKVIKKPHQAVSRAFSGKNTNHKLNSMIAGYFGKTLAEFFPDLYCVVPGNGLIHESKVNEINDSVN
ncbi:MAG: hypothetical protein ABFD79_02780 [Phycisphaerales bacterium]